jgi:hypothetical protein
VDDLDMGRDSEGSTGLWLVILLTSYQGDDSQLLSIYGWELETGIPTETLQRVGLFELIQDLRKFRKR